jgi:cob(I)alamin adenosyltransferase
LILLGLEGIVISFGANMGYRLSKIYTRTGDDGTTSLDGKKRLLKHSLPIETVGTLDELNCTLGLMLAQPSIDASIFACLTEVQNHLFDLGGELCLPQHVVITAEHVIKLEQQLDQWNADLPPLKEFILPRGNLAAVHCHLARAICRRAERCLVALSQEQALNPQILSYVNRLSDLLFVAARVLAKGTGEQEVLWKHER